MLIAIVPIIIAIIGAFIYILAAHAKACELGRIMFFVGLLWSVFAVLGRVVRIT